MKLRNLVIGGMAALALSAGAAPAVAAPAAGPPGGGDDLAIGGHDASEQYDWMASLQKGGKHACGASLIDQQWVLTAAHCVKDAQPKDFGLRIGSPDQTKGGTQAGVAQIISHPDYAAEEPNGDVALIKLDHPVKNEPVKIADKAGEAGSPSRIIGWGLECPIRGCGQPPAQLQELETQVVTSGDCLLSSIDKGTETCTGSKELLANACFGDSGGPQLEGQPGEWRLTGVTSRLGSPAPVCGTAPSVYTDATVYKDWISQQISA